MATIGTRLVLSTIAVMGLGLGLGACGGSHKTAAAPTADDADSGGGGTATADDSGGDDGMVPGEKLDRIREILDSKRLTMSRCLSQAIADGKASKDAKGEVVLEFKINPSGKAHDIKVTRSTVKSKEVDSCVVDKLGQMVFPELPRDLNWSYTYAFESN